MRSVGRKYRVEGYRTARELSKAFRSLSLNPKFCFLEVHVSLRYPDIPLPEID